MVLLEFVIPGDMSHIAQRRLNAKMSKFSTAKRCVSFQKVCSVLQCCRQTRRTADRNKLKLQLRKISNILDLCRINNEKLPYLVGKEKQNIVSLMEITGETFIRPVGNSVRQMTGLLPVSH